MRQFIVESTEKAKKVGSIRAESLCLHAHGAVDYLLGDWVSATTNLVRSVELARQVESTFGEVLGLQRAAIIQTSLGNLNDGFEQLQAALEIAQASDSPMVQVHSMTRLLGSLAHNRVEAGDHQAALAYLTQGLKIQGMVGKCVPCDVLLYPAAVPLHIALGDLEKADEACSQLEEAATNFGSRAWVAQARFLRGILAGEFQEWGRSKTLLREALGIYEELGQPYETALCQQALGEVLLRGERASDDEEPEALLETALATYKRLGATVRRDALTQLLSEVVS